MLLLTCPLCCLSRGLLVCGAVGLYPQPPTPARSKIERGSSEPGQSQLEGGPQGPGRQPSRPAPAKIGATAIISGTLGKLSHSRHPRKHPEKSIWYLLGTVWCCLTWQKVKSSLEFARTRQGAAWE